MTPGDALKALETYDALLLVAGIVLASVVVHGTSAGPLMSSLDRLREKAGPKHA